MHNITSPQSDDVPVEHQIVAKGLTAPRVTPDMIAALMNRLTFKLEYFYTSTMCHVFLDGEFYLGTGHSACISLENYDKSIGDRIAIEDAKAKANKQLWLLEGYALRKTLNA